MKPLTAIFVAALIGVVVAGIVLRLVIGDGPDVSRPVTAALASGAAPDAITIEVFSSNTKENWINAAVERFNREQHTISSGQPIFVQAAHVTSGGSQRDILAGKIQPTVWSPGDSSWVEGANEVWRDRTGQSLVSGACPSTILAPSGFAMWRPMAEALGWPDKPISWDDLVALERPPQEFRRLVDHRGVTLVYDRPRNPQLAATNTNRPCFRWRSTLPLPTSWRVFF